MLVTRPSTEHRRSSYGLSAICITLLRSCKSRITASPFALSIVSQPPSAATAADRQYAGAVVCSSDAWRRVESEGQLVRGRSWSVSRPGSSSTSSTVSMERGDQGEMVNSSQMESVDWMTADTGRFLCDAAHRRSADGNGIMNYARVREEYIDGVKYLLKALPPNLTETELDKLDSALPAELQEIAEQRQARRNDLRRRRKSNLLSKSISWAILRSAMLLSILLPLLLGFLGFCLRYERENHLTEKFVDLATSALNSLQKREPELLACVSHFGHGRVGKVLIGGTAWVIDGVVQGVADGAGRSASVLGSAIVLRP